MSRISFQPYPKLPQISFFNPVSADFKDSMTDIEFLLGILKKLNEVIKKVNEQEEYIDNIPVLEAEFEALRNDYNQFKIDVNNDIDERFTNLTNEIVALINLRISDTIAYIDSKTANLQHQIDNISVGKIRALDPTTGEYNDLQDILFNIANTSKEDSLTATEFDALELTATAFDAYEITAFDFDYHNKSILV